MEIVNIFLTSKLGEGPGGEALEDFVHDDRRLVFDFLGADGPQRLVDGPVWAFIDWVMEDLAGLEMCRRLRADPRTADAHVTMVLEHDDEEAIEDNRRRALNAGADDYFQARWDGTVIEARPNEFRLLRYFAQNAGQVMSRETIIAGLGKTEPVLDERTVDVWVGRLRRAIKAAGGGNPLRTVRSVGYVLDL